ncbi:MAG: PhzF family phenazine biosynthesis protein [Nitrospiraceae bacterium]|nr:PhzF family phenazine biosynthesis protein [Nitrospiraceae bacterium]
MNIKYHVIDAFSDRVFGGNPAGVCFLDNWLEDLMLRRIAAENNLSETAFLVQKANHYELRWFTPGMEIDLCGHATLASAYAVFEYMDKKGERVEFETKSGRLRVERQKDLLVMDFPSRRPVPCAPPSNIAEILGMRPALTLKSRDLLAVYEDERQIRGLSPDIGKLAALDFLGVIVTAKGERSDFVSRFFAPRAGIPEDPVTGSAHCTLVPYWSQRLAKKKLHSLQLSERGGELFCEDKGERVTIGGRAAAYLSGTIRIGEKP